MSDIVELDLDIIYLENLAIIEGWFVAISIWHYLQLQGQFTLLDGWKCSW